ncbi:hypothetical protein PHLGIDRAFT_16792 [Phlebiopsis gigantea 11061_1 CR5-6]|uniref:Uncharacterized protein n=1 Tax=Phlebiopsis gigantea (strain 11061_1 CR5-6) TaxID=745531 RepID=A0A0C3NC40_PHLG1|nr:hypothetical protein PHLGIDRAFT_16792 [Phlebiopsis gigantea 11061_1 CR5-6]
MFNFNNDQAYHEDPALLQSWAKPKPKELSAPMDVDKPNNTQGNKNKVTENKQQPKKSKLQQHISPCNIPDKVLNTPVTMAIGELLAISKEVWLNALSRPMDVTKKVYMGDANGGEGILQGFILDVPLTCGAVLT